MANTYYTTKRPSKEHIDKMLRKAKQVEKRQTELLIENGDEIVIVQNKRKFNKGFKVKK